VNACSEEKKSEPDKGEKYPGSEQDAGVKKHVQDVPMNDEKMEGRREYERGGKNRTTITNTAQLQPVLRRYAGEKRKRGRKKERRGSGCSIFGG
jgi:hypothetical protein